jgi:hypothetical protein
MSMIDDHRFSRSSSRAPHHQMGEKMNAPEAIKAGIFLFVTSQIQKN